MKSIILTLFIAFGFALQGCGTVVLSTVAALNATSPLTADPAGFEVAVDMPEGGDIAPDGATINLFMSHTVLGEDVNETYVLQRRQSADGRILFRINPRDLDMVRAFQAKARTWEANDPDASSGGFGVSVVACSVGDGPADDATFSVSIRTQVDGGFMPLIRNARVMDAIEAVEGLDDDAQNPTAARCE
ncbi:hypothetical protein K3729_04720 [Rhodobacteraceae bacterium S2214]|nr:hypothetical protein K3729_04720 [Rhodobacteraceae bacterium S2214]